MEFKLTIENLGNIEHATLAVKPFTIIAGENSSGKTFATKSLYCVLDAIHRDHISIRLALIGLRFERALSMFSTELKNPSQADIQFMEYVESRFIEWLNQLIRHSHESDIQTQTLLSDSQKTEFNEYLKYIQGYCSAKTKVKKFKTVKVWLEEFLKLNAELLSVLDDGSKVIVQGIENALSENFKKNYQTAELSQLINHHHQEKELKVVLDKVGQLALDKTGGWSFRFERSGVMEVQTLRNIVYVDSPVYLKIRQGLEKKAGLGIIGNAMDDRYLKGYPQYIEKLYRYIDQKFIDQPDFVELADELREMIGGNLQVAKNGEVSYHTEKGQVPLNLTAMGISNIGLIELLLRNNVINKGSFLIIDEPEAHLHPKWQAALVTILYHIAKAGAHIIIATHSIDIVKQVQVLLKNEADAGDYIALNQMPYDTEFYQQDLNNQVHSILEVLSEPFFDAYMEGL